MTLVVARIVNNDVFVIGDSKLTNASGGPIRSPLQGTLKIQVLNPNFCMAFAGEVRPSTIEGLNIISKKYSVNANEVILDKLLDLHNRNDQQLDFIIATASPAPAIFKISQGDLLENLQTAFIGDFIAFNAYQERFHQEEHVENFERTKLWVLRLPDHEGANQDIFSKMCRAMRNVIHDARIPSVGDFLLPVTSTTDGFNYMHYVDIDAPPQISNPGWNTVRFGTAGEGGYSIVALSPKTSGVRALGIHFFQGNFGAFFAPDFSFTPLIYRNTNRSQFIEVIKSRFEIELYGPEVS